MKPVTYFIGHELMKEGDPVKYIYLVAKGQFEMTKSLYFRHKQAKFNKEVDFDDVKFMQYSSVKGNQAG